ncbi:conserved phage C-terminal domain-containing protein [Bacillus infantis]|nr:conserved phage C-terminal domain-containing protein [Bacillus infantis]MCK6203957.1 conserved phage C-terminal domain-containing protein [Bacillus infantis]
MMCSPIWQDPYYFKLWMYCLMKASHKEHDQLVGNQMVKLERGQFVTGRKVLAEELNKGVKPDQQLSEKSWARYLKNLEKWQMLSINVTNKFSVVTVVNYGFYQDTASESDQQTDQQLTSSCPTSDQQLTTNKNVNNAKNDKNEKKEDIPYVEIVSYLNEKANTSYRPSSKKTQQLIKARCNEGFKFPDFQTVIDKKVSEWLKDSKMNQYLRPETLFGTKFESYLNQKGGAPNGETFNTASPAEEYNLPF